MYIHLWNRTDDNHPFGDIYIGPFKNPIFMDRGQFRADDKLRYAGRVFVFTAFEDSEVWYKVNVATMIEPSSDYARYAFCELIPALPNTLTVLTPDE